MSDYGVTNQGFVLKRMDTILEEIHSDLTEGFGVDTPVVLSLIHISEPTRQEASSYAVFCLKQKKTPDQPEEIP